MIASLRNAVLLGVLAASPALAQTAEIFIPGQKIETPEAPVVPQNRLAACLADVNAANCTGLNLDPDGISNESFADGPQVQFETLILDLDGDHVTSSPEPPDYPTDHAKPVAPYSTVTLPAIAITIQFDFDSAAIRADQIGKIASLAEAFRDPALTGIAYAIIGHTDSSGSDYYNCDLSLRRAISVGDALRGQYVGLPLYQIGFGEHVPKNRHDTRAPENRRVTFLRLPKDWQPVLDTARAVCRL